MGINLGNDFNAAVANAAGLPNTIDPATVDIAFFNPNGPTTVRATIVTTVDSNTLGQLVQQYTTPTT